MELAIEKKRRKRVTPEARLIFWGAVVAILLAGSLAGPFLTPHDPYAVELSQINQPPSAFYWMGTDYLGRCIACRLIHGAARSVFSSVLVVTVTFLVGTLVGMASGYLGGLWDSLLMRLVDSVQAFPSLIFTIAVAAMLGGGLGNCLFAMCGVGWTRYARLARSQVLGLREKNFVYAARMSGMSRPAILLQAIFPNALPPLLVEASMHIGNAILSFAGLSYLGLGTAPPYPEWGNMLSDGQATLQTAPWTVLFPGLAILLVVMIMGLLGDSVNAVLNPKKMEGEVRKYDHA